MTTDSFTYTADAAALPGPESRSIEGEELWTLPDRGTAGMQVTPRTAVTFPALLAVLNTLATDVAALPCRVYRRLDDGSRRLEPSHVVDDLLNVSPDGETTAFTWRQSLTLHALLHGNGYAEIERTIGSKRPVALHLLDPETTSPYRDQATRKLKYRISNGKTLDAANVFHLSGLSYDAVCGWSFVDLIKTAIGVGLAEEAFQGDFFANGSEPGGVVEMDEAIRDPKKRDQFKRDWDGRHRGPGKRHGVALLEGGAKYKPTGVDPDKAQLLGARQYQVLEVARPWRVPPHKVGDFTQAHLANLEASNLDYLTTALLPWLIAFEQQALLKLFTLQERRAGWYAEHLVDALLRADLLKRYQAYEVGIRNGLLSRNECRRRENDAPIPASQGGDAYTVQMQVVNLAGTLAGPAPASTPPGTSDDSTGDRPAA